MKLVRQVLVHFVVDAEALYRTSHQVQTHVGRATFRTTRTWLVV